MGVYDNSKFITVNFSEKYVAARHSNRLNPKQGTQHIFKDTEISNTQYYNQTAYHLRISHSQRP